MQKRISLTPAEWWESTKGHSKERHRVADACGIPYHYLYEVITGRKDGSIKLCQKISDATGGAIEFIRR